MSKAKRFIESIQNKIYEFANPISRTESKITELGKPVVDHLIKILKWDDKIHNQKHCKDIDNWLDQVEDYFISSKTKPKSGKVSFWIYFEFRQRSIDSIMKKLTRQYSKLPQYRNDQEVIICLEKILYEIDEQLQKNNSLDSIIEICEKLEIEIKSCKNYWS